MSLPHPGSVLVLKVGYVAAFRRQEQQKEMSPIDTFHSRSAGDEEGGGLIS
jgi:hypothetical protein